LADELVRPFFEGLDMPAQVRKQVAFMTVAFGGPDEYRGRNMREAHAKLVAESGLGDGHFDAIVEHLRSTLVELDVQETLINAVIDTVEKTRTEVLGK
jgi:hemoglobin